MSMREWSKTTPMRIALSALVLASVLFLWTLVHAFRADALPVAAPNAVTSLDAMTRVSFRPPANIETAVESDLFSADRSAPAKPYRMPGEDRDDKPKVEPPKPVLLGTGVASDGRNFATLQLGPESPKLVRVSDKIGEWVVKSIERGKVVLVSTSGIRAELAAPKPGT